MFAVVIYLQGFHIEIPVKSNRFRGQRGSYPVKLFYTSNMPIVLKSALTSHVYIVSQMLFSHFPDNSSLKLSEFGRYVKWLRAPPFNTNFLFRLGSLWKNLLSLLPPLASLITSLLRTLHPALVDPIHTVLYILFMTSVCAIFSKTWIEVSGSGPRDMAKQLKDQQLVMAGHRKVSPPYHINQGPTQTMS
jgi:protein transport protein SEC61 subunit alpha